MNSNLRLTSLKTADLAGGMALSLVLARELSDRMRSSHESIQKPGGTNYGEPASIPEELIAGILLAAISIANNGWSKNESAAA